jgi:V/A-type H+-transporting ATPase subunit D
MAIKFQYNKTSLQMLDKQLKMRTKALPTIKSKEAALRLEVKKAKVKVRDVEARLDEKNRDNQIHQKMWTEFVPDFISVDEVKTSWKKIAGVKIPIFDSVSYKVQEFSLFGYPYWFAKGLDFLKEIISLTIEKEICEQQVQLLSYTRRKTTQKVNLYEKVQIPGYQNAILKIKRFLEDEENLSKSAQKIVKKRHEEAEDTV